MIIARKELISQKRIQETDETIDYFDREWNLLDLRQNYPNSLYTLEKPNCYDEMLRLADRLAQDKKSFLRVDLYYINGSIYFSEYTMFSDSGMAAFCPASWDMSFGEKIEL